MVIDGQTETIATCPHYPVGWLTTTLPEGSEGWRTTTLPEGSEGWLTTTLPVGSEGWLTTTLPEGSEGWLICWCVVVSSSSSSSSSDEYSAKFSIGFLSLLSKKFAGSLMKRKCLNTTNFIILNSAKSLPWLPGSNGPFTVVFRSICPYLDNLDTLIFQSKIIGPFNFNTKRFHCYTLYFFKYYFDICLHELWLGKDKYCT